MPPKSKRLANQRVSPDIVTNLPDNVIDVILMRLPLRDAVRTSILSKKWRYNWTRIPQLTFDRALWETIKDSIFPTMEFTTILSHIFALHAGPVTKCTLSIPNLGNCPRFDVLIHFLYRNDIQDLTLQLPKDDPYKLPSSFFTCSHMRRLALRNCIIHPPWGFRGFDRLIKLELCQVTISSKLLESLISHSPLLEHLVLQSDILDHIQVNAPKLRSIDYAGNMNSISFGKVPRLVELSLWDTGSLENAGKCDVAEFFEPFPALERLALNYLVVKVLAAGAEEVPKLLPSSLNHLKSLSLYDISLGDTDEVSCALCLIRSSPYLQDMEIRVYNGAVNKIPALESLEVAGFSDVTFNRLRTIKLEGITGKNLEMQLIKLLLAKSPVLVTMLIDPGVGDESLQTRVKVLAQLTKFRRASAQVEVVYDIDCNAPSIDPNKPVVINL